MHKYVQNRVLAYLKMLLALTDAVSLNILFVLAYSVVANNGWMDVGQEVPASFYSLWTTFNLVAIISSLYMRLYADATIERLENVFRITLRTALLLVAIFAGCILIGHHLKGVWVFFVVVAAGMFIYLALSRFVLTYVYTVLPRRLGWSKQVALIGHNDYMAGVAGILAKEHPFYHVNTIAYRDDPGLPNKDDTLTRFRRYFEEVASLGIFDVFVVNSPDISSCSRELIMAADSKCVHLNFVTAPAEMMPYSSKDGVLTVELPVLRSHDESLSTMENRIKKRIVDLVISTFVIVFILSWLIPIIGLIIKIQSPGPIFFKQPRSGRNNQTFDCYKFRSMVVNTESNAKQAVKGDKRITAIGQFLRKTNLDEFPQFINVFLGQMSVVGPRPHMLAHTEHYSQLIQHYMVRHFVKPGITGWAQVNGCRGETKDPGAMAKRVEYDLDYMNNWSAMLDFKIVCMTVLNMLQGEKNAY
ncbi:exopolysaccharide biosynthesis polyprenyl glycosylphosphotransferase [Sphingobacterium multivorum]|uniref:exopolysaccharide biosynthesis polyprenyl glycosylphosphotransferase n=1 Tax=Sphingobacterium multivorum TaxID=28454 RepID=UPI003DA2C43F